MFGKYFSHVLVLTLLAGTAYSLPQVKDAMGDAFALGYTGQAAAIQSISVQPIIVKEINAKVVFDSKHQESAINITAKVQITAVNSDMTLSPKSPFSGNLVNKTLNISSYLNFYIQSASIKPNSDGSYTIKKGSSATFTAFAQRAPSTLIAGQYYANLNAAYINGSNWIVSSNKSNLITIVGEASPYVTVVGQGKYGKKDTIILNSVRLGQNPTITFQQIPYICSVGNVCPVGQLQTFPIKSAIRNGQIRFDLSQTNLPAGSYNVFVTNTQLGATSGKSNIIGIQILDQSNVITAKVTPGTLALSYDSAQKESALSAPFVVVIKAGDKDMQFGQGSFSVVATNSNNNQINAPTTINSINNLNNISFPFTLKAGTEGTFKITATVNPKIMFAGAYTMSLFGVYPLVQPSTSTPIYTAIQVPVPANQTNSVVIVGETSPYISSISPNPVVSGHTLTISGQRLSGAQVIFDGAPLVCPISATCVSYDVSGNAIEIPLPASTTDGYHMLQVKNANGLSNMVWFQSTGGAVLNQVTISNISTTKGALVIDSTGTKQSQPVGFSFTLTAGNNPIFLSTKVTDSARLEPNSSIEFAAKSFIVPRMITFASTPGQVGDTNAYFYVAPGTSRQFTFDGMLGSDSSIYGTQNGVNIAQIMEILYGTDANNLSQYSIHSGIDNLKIISDITIASTPTSSITVVSPNGGETLQDKQTYQVRWESKNVSSNSYVDIWLLDNPTRLGSMVLSHVPNTGSANWIVAPLSTLTDKNGNSINPSGKYVMFINCSDNSCTVDDSDSSFTIAPSTSNLPPVISGGAFPTTLNVGQTGTWTVNASNPQNGSLSYSVNWGDANPSCAVGQICPILVPAVVQTSTFTHSYANPGTYTVNFTVTNSTGLSAKTSATVQVNSVVTPPIVVPAITVLSPNGGETLTAGTFKKIDWKDTSNLGDVYTVELIHANGTASIINSGVKSSFSWLVGNLQDGSKTDGVKQIRICLITDGSIKVCGTSNQFTIVSTTPPIVVPAITVLSPNGGETWTKGTTQNIKWNAPTNIVASYVDISMVRYSPPCTTNVCPVSTIAPYSIAKKVSINKHSYVWKVSTLYGGNEYAPDGLYNIVICQSGTNICDSSDNPFKISSQTRAQSSSIWNAISELFGW